MHLTYFICKKKEKKKPITQCWERWTGYKLNLQLFAQGGCSPDSNARSYILDSLSLYHCTKQWPLPYFICKRNEFSQARTKICHYHNFEIDSLNQQSKMYCQQQFASMLCYLNVGLFGILEHKERRICNSIISFMLLKIVVPIPHSEIQFLFMQW